MRAAFLATVAVSLVSRTLAATWSISDTIIGADFYDAFNFQAIADPTHGRVQYVDEATAKANNLTYASDSTFILRADYKKVVPSSSTTGRQSVRIQSNAQYTSHVVVFDVKHMPQGCGTWPALWETGTSNWPNLGEVDILEGANDQGPNQMTLHTSSGCTIPSSSDQSGTTVSTNCDAKANSNRGCGVKDKRQNSYGPSFNSNGGGWFAMERADDLIKVWFWPRNGAVPNDVKNGESTVDSGAWGQPAADFPNTSCDFTQKFGKNVIRINLTLCGDLAGGSSYGNAGCPGSCNDYVDNNPSDFKNAYFEIASVRVYE